MKKQHIAFCANTAWSMLNFRKGVITELIKQGYQVTIIAPKDDSFSQLKKLGVSTQTIPLAPKSTNPFKDIKLTLELVSIYKQLKPDLIFHYTIKPNIYGSLAAKLAKTPSIAITTGLGYTFINKNITANIARLLYKIAFHFPQEIWFLNNDDLTTFLQYNLVSSSKARLLDGEGVNTDFFSPMPVRTRDNKIVFLLIARMLWDKGVGEFVEAARIVQKKYPNAQFQLLGACGVDNPSAVSNAQIKKWKKEKVIEYLGTTSDVRSNIAKADCIVLPSYREGIPRTLLEAAAMEKPIISTKTAGCKEVVQHNVTGYLCTPKNPKSLAKFCTKFIKLSSVERARMGSISRTYIIKRFDEKHIISKYTSTIKKLITFQ